VRTSFTVLHHQGRRDSIQLQLIGDRTLLAVLFDERTNLGLVRFYAQETARQLTTVLAELSERPPEAGPSCRRSSRPTPPPRSTTCSSDAARRARRPCCRARFAPLSAPP
jgi:hypothetical protein